MDFSRMKLAQDFLNYLSGINDPDIPMDKLQKHFDEMPRSKVDGVFEVKDRVEVKDTAGFSRGSKGVVTLIDGTRIWVLRDGASSAVFFSPWELSHEK